MGIVGEKWKRYVCSKRQGLEKEVRSLNEGQKGRGWLYKGHTTCNLMVSELLVSRVMVYIYADVAIADWHARLRQWAFTTCEWIIFV
jgi:hypothetical protein